MKLIDFTQNPTEVTFEIQHEDLVQSITISKTYDQWVASLPLHDLPKCNSPDEAAKKLGEWMYRMSQAIRDNDGEFSKIDLTNIKIDKD